MLIYTVLKIRIKLKLKLNPTLIFKHKFRVNDR